jgi:hypothetical protein
MTREEVQAWLDRYIEAWSSYDAGAIGDLFSDDARYRYHPSDEGFVGREAIVRAWLEPSGDASTRDEPGTWEARYEPFAVDGDRAVAVGSSRYFTDASKYGPGRVGQRLSARVRRGRSLLVVHGVLRGAPQGPAVRCGRSGGEVRVETSAVT